MRYYYEGHFTDGNGRAIEAGTITVSISAPGNILATIYDSLSSLTPISGSVVTSASDGKFYFFMDCADYDVYQRFRLTMTKQNYITKIYSSVRLSNIVAATSDDGVITFTVGDTTPSVKGFSKLYKTANVGATTITNFDDGVNGQEITVLVSDAATTVDFSANANLKGNGGSDWSPASGDMLRGIYYNGTWYCSVHDCT
jgi:hypothetical protein